MPKKLISFASVLIAGLFLFSFWRGVSASDVFASMQTTTSAWLGALPAAQLSLMPLYALSLLMVLIAFVCIASLVVTLCANRRIQISANETAHMLCADRRRTSLAASLAHPQGWATVAAQLVADALNQTVSISATSSSVIDVATTPAPRFTVSAVDGRRYTFTIDPSALRREGLLPKQAQVIDLSLRGEWLSLDAQLLWESLQHSSQSALHMAVPQHMKWHLVTVIPTVAFVHRVPHGFGDGLPLRVLRTLHLL